MYFLAGTAEYRTVGRLSPVLKQFSINVSYHKVVASLTLMALF